MSGPADPLYTQLSGDVTKEQRARLEQITATERPDDVSSRSVTRDGFPPEELLVQIASDGSNLVVIGTHGRTGVKRVGDRTGGARVPCAGDGHALIDDLGETRIARPGGVRQPVEWAIRLGFGDPLPAPILTRSSRWAVYGWMSGYLCTAPRQLAIGSCSRTGVQISQTYG